MFNNGAFTQWKMGAQRLDGPFDLSRFNRYPRRAFQMTVNYKF